MALSSLITTQYVADQPRVLDANYRIGSQSDRQFIDSQILGVQTHLCDSLIRGQIGTNFVLSGTSAALVPGDMFCAAGDAALELPSGTAVRKVTKATALALAASGVVLGVAMTSAQPGAWVRGALEGLVGSSVTGLAAGAAGPVRVGANGRAERVVALSSGDFPVGYVDGFGNLSLARERAVGAGGGGGGGYTTVLNQGVAVTQRSTIDFVGAGVSSADVGGVTRVTISSSSGPTGSAVGQTQLWDGAAWQAGALDLADADARTGTLPAANGGTGIAGAGGTANRVLTTTNGSTWVAGLVALTTMVSGLLPPANFADGSATSVFGRSLGTSGAQASIAASADGQTLRRSGGVLGFGALNLADNTNAVTGLLPLANLTGGAAVGQVLRNTGGNLPAWGALDLADADAVTGLLPFANFADGSATSVFGRSGGTSGVMAPIAASADGQFLQRAGGSLVWATVPIGSVGGGTAVGQVLRNTAGNIPAWGAVDLADTDAVTGQLPIANIASLSGMSVLGRSNNTTGTMVAITGTADQVLRINAAGTALLFGTLATASYSDASVTLAKLANGTASSVLGRSAATGGAYADIVSSADGQVLRRGASGVIGWGAVDLADTDGVTGLLPFANFSNIAGLSVFGRASDTSGVGAAITGADGQVLRVAGTTLSFGTIAATGITDGTIPVTKLAAGTAASVLGRSAATGGPYADITSAADGQILRRAAGVVGWGALDLSDTDGVTGTLALANMPSLAGLSVLGRGGSTSGVMAGLTGTANQVLRVDAAGTTLAFGTLGAGSFSDGTIPIVKLANGTAASVLGRSAATAGAYADIVSSADGQVFRRAAGVVGWGALDLADADGVTGLLPHANLASLAGLSVFGRGVNSSGAMGAITGADGQVLRVAGTTLGFGAIVTAGITDANVTLAKLANGTASSVLGRSAATGGVYADITSSADGQVLRRGASGVIGFGAVDLADADAVTGLLSHLNLASLTGLSVLGRSANTAGGMAAITGTDGQVLRVSGTTLGFGALALTGLTGGSAVGQVLRNTAGNIPAWGALDLADPDARTGLLPLANLAPGSNGLVLVTAGGVPTWSASLGNSTDAFVYNAASHTWAVGGANKIFLTASTLQTANDLTTWSFASGTSDRAIVFSPTSVAATNGAALFIQGQSVTGTGTPVGGPVYVRAGSSTNGVGGALELWSGDGPLGNGGVNIRTSASVQLAIGGGNVNAQANNIITTGDVVLGSAPPGSGRVRFSHGDILTGLTVSAAIRSGVSWGVSSANVWEFGDDNANTNLTGGSVFITGAAGAGVASMTAQTVFVGQSAGNIGLFGASGFGGGASVMALGGTVTAPTSAPATGALIYHRTGAVEARVQQGGVWQMAAGSAWHHLFYGGMGSSTTSSTAANQGIGTLGGGASNIPPTGSTGIARVYVSCHRESDGLAIGALDVSVFFKQIGTTLTVTGGSTNNDFAAGSFGALIVPAGTSLVVQVTPGSSEVRRYRILIEFTYYTV
jgi:hypothetical protein